MAVSKRATAGVVGAGVLALAGAGLWLYAQPPASGQASSLDALARGEMAALVVADDPAPTTDHPFVDAEGREMSLAAFRGRVAVVNLWATWCAPCLAEMPTLAALATAYGDDPEVEVVAISVDVPAQRDRAVAFMAQHPPLDFYNDPTFQLPFSFGARGGMPQTILLDREGRVRATLTGGADWSGAEARALVEAIKAEG